MKKSLEFPIYLFHQGTNFRAYELLGAHSAKAGGESGFVFRVWAPNAKAVSVAGSFCKWDERAHPMVKISGGGIWEAFVPGVKQGDLYKFAITAKNGKRLLKADPYAAHCETRPATASIVYEPEYKWGDGKWLAARKKADFKSKPLNIYEVQLGSWRRYKDGEIFDYRKSADELAAYAKDMGYTHVELLPITEYPFDGSWGYQCLGYYAPTSRYGAPEDFMYFVDTLHRAGLGVIMDWVPAHFPKDGYGLIDFDGGACYEYKNPLMAEREEWGTRVFDFGRSEVRCFLISSAMYWIEKYHIDGIRADAVSSMLYRDYGKKDGRWLPNKFGGKENFEAVALLRDLNTAAAKEYPGVMTIAEESTAWPYVTKPASAGGLGFSFKWNMGWMNDTLHYMSLDPVFRSYNHDKLTFGMVYAFSENYILPFSHDEVVHGKCSLINKMPGEYEQKFSGLRALFAYMIGCPGKKLLFMGQEFGQFIEWDENREIDWLLLQYESHRRLWDWSRALNHLYIESPSLWNEQDGWENFSWASCDSAAENAVAFRRMDRESGDELMFVFNFSANPNQGVVCGLSEKSSWREILNSDDPAFGGSGDYLNSTLRSRKRPFGGFENSVTVKLAPLSAAVFRKIKKV